MPLDVGVRQVLEEVLEVLERIQALALAVSMMLSTAALALAPFGESLNSQFLRPMVKSRMARSQMLFESAALPLFRKA